MEIKELQGVIKLADYAKEINRGMGLNSSVMRMMQAQKDWQDKLIPFRNHHVISSIANMRNIFNQYEQRGIMAMMQSSKMASLIIVVFLIKPQI